MRKINKYNDPEFKVVLFSTDNEVISTSFNGPTLFGTANGFDDKKETITAKEFESFMFFF